MGRSFVGEDFDVGEPGGVVDANVDELPTSAARPALLAAACHSMARAAMADSAELLDIDVDQLARPDALIGWWSRSGS
jgi:hypothetical protein